MDYDTFSVSYSNGMMGLTENSPPRPCFPLNEGACHTGQPCQPRITALARLCNAFATINTFGGTPNCMCFGKLCGFFFPLSKTSGSCKNTIKTSKCSLGWRIKLVFPKNPISQSEHETVLYAPLFTSTITDRGRIFYFIL